MDPEDPEFVEETAPMTRFPSKSFCLLLSKFAIEVTCGCDSGKIVSRKRRILLNIVHGMTYGTAGAPKTAAAIAFQEKTS